MGVAFSGAGLALSAPSAFAFSDDASGKLNPNLIRRVELNWEAMDEAARYEIEFGTDSTFKDNLYAEKTGSTRFTVNVIPGSYYYRVRAIDRTNQPGQWTDIHELNVNPRPPTLIWPRDTEVIRGNLSDTGLPMNWASSGPSVRYLIEIKQEDEQGNFTNTVVKQEWDSTNYPFFPELPGRFQWSVHTLGPGGDEPGTTWTFTVEGVYPRRGKTKIVRFIPPWWRGHWNLTSRYGQANMSYQIVDQDLRGSSAFSGLTGYVGATLNWEWHDPVSWALGGIPWWELEAEIDRQTVLGESIVLPQKIVRAGAWYDEWVDNMRFSPVLEFGVHDVAIYQAQSATEAARVNSTRDYLGLGVAAEYQLKTFFTLQAFATLRMEQGGQAGFVPVNGNLFQNLSQNRAGNLLPNSDFVLGTSGRISLTKKISVQGRLRYVTDKGSWNPIFFQQAIAGNPGGITNFSLTNVMFDIGVGYRF